MTAEEITQTLQDWLIGKTGESFEPDQPYAASGALDSFDVLALVRFAEEKFGLAFSAEDFADPAFATLAGLAKIIQSKPRGS